MPTFLGAHNARIDAARDLLTKKGRAQQNRFSFEGATLLQEAHEAGVRIEALYLTKSASENLALLAQQLEDAGTDVFVVEERAMKRISDVRTPSGILAVAPIVLREPERILDGAGTVLLLADVSDPGNAGTLLRTAEAFGAAGVIVGSLGVEPYNPKVVRAAMGALFRVPLALADPDGLRRALEGWDVTGLTAAGVPLSRLEWGPRTLLVVGNERHGLGRWEALCTRHGSIPMAGQAESLNAGVAGSIALYEATKRSTS